MTWFKLMKISLGDEVYRYWKEQGELQIKHNKYRYGPAEKYNIKEPPFTKVFYVNGQEDISELIHYFKEKEKWPHPRNPKSPNYNIQTNVVEPNRKIIDIIMHKE